MIKEEEAERIGKTEDARKGVPEQVAAAIEDTKGKPDDWVKSTAKKALTNNSLSFLLFSETGRKLIAEHSREELETVVSDLKK